jgi:hypothetical protein
MASEGYAETNFTASISFNSAGESWQKKPFLRNLQVEQLSVNSKP